MKRLLVIIVVLLARRLSPNPFKRVSVVHIKSPAGHKLIIQRIKK